MPPASHEAYVAAINDVLAPDAAARFGASIERRLAGEPVSRIIGIREFYGRPFRIDAKARPIRARTPRRWSRPRWHWSTARACARGR
jgi:hypothetical protein